MQNYSQLLKNLSWDPPKKVKTCTRYIVNGLRFHTREKVQIYFEEVQNDETEIEWDCDEDFDEETDKDFDARTEEKRSRALHTAGFIAFNTDVSTDSRTTRSVDSSAAGPPHTYTGTSHTDTGIGQFRRSWFIIRIGHTNTAAPSDTRQLLTLNVDR
ncbi:hypothetical protein M9H77_03122 [Catharanthus roseus]|uniref:Uncharacterized protein n=1 Tax=Catharanthus roseus TaxID=4058 RepID=A0ACC0CAI3_CATRO|nr:hypothetical protein M9H77_03122 [Catharanthus roseus]